MRRHLRAVAGAAAFFVVLVTAAALAEEGGATPTFRVENGELDIGTVVAGSVVTATFVFHNDGPEDVHIIRAKPS